MDKWKKHIGAFGEKIATDFLKRKGYLILHKNFRCNLGEIDIVAQDKDVIVFVEVRMRCSDYYGSPVESILWKKKKKLSMLANFYMKRFNLAMKKSRFDVVSLMKKADSLDIELIKDAFWEV